MPGTITLGIVDLVLLVLLLIAVYQASRRRGLGAAILIIIILVIILLERVAPGTMASIGSAIHSLDVVNAAGPHLTIQPIIHFTQ
jgi:hypothetical protein